MKIDAPRALRFCEAILRSHGTPAVYAKTVAAHLIDADLKGVRSHGLLRLIKYVDQIDSGYIDNKAKVQIKAVTENLLHVDAHKNWGIVALDALVPALGELASAKGIAGASLVNCAHTGRIGAFSEALASRFMWGMVFGGGANEKLKEVAPFGGATGKFDTNPYAFSMPVSEKDLATSDFATSATAQGKVLVYRTNKAPVPEGWIIDKEGHPTTEAEDFYDGGALLPSGGHKGYGMAFIAELFGEAALGTPHELNWFVIAVDLNRLTQRSSYFERAGKLRGKIENCPPAEGFAKVMWPGQPELESEKGSLAVGIEYSELEIKSLSSLESRFNIHL